MRTRLGLIVLAGVLALVGCVRVGAQLLPQVTAKPKKPPAKHKPAEPKPAQIVVQTSPDAQVNLDDTFKGQASPQGRLVVANPATGEHALHVSRTGKKDYEKPVTVVAGEAINVQAKLADIEKPKPTIGTAKENSKDGLKYMWIPPGNFQMGCSPGDSECYDNEKASHRVTITRGFSIGQTPVTVAAYKRFSSESSHAMPPAPDFNLEWTNDHMPIVAVKWNDAQAYCTWAGGRLPTEAEWEYAARAGSTEARYGDIDAIAWYTTNSGNRTHNVGQKQANAWGLYDMLGNVWQWVNDWYDENYYQNSPSQDPTGPSSGTLRVLRGGSWINNPKGVRVSYRFSVDPGYRVYSGGFRCVGELVSP